LTLPASRSLRHCMIVDNGYPDPRVEREARALVRRGHRVDVICARSGDEPRRARIDGVSVHRLPLRRQRGGGMGSQLLEYVAFTAWAAAKLMQLQQRGRFDVVQVHNVPDFLVLSALPAKLRGTPVILDLHDLMPEFFASRFGDRMEGWRVSLVKWQERISMAIADHAITVTDLWRDVLISRGAAADRVEVVMNVPDEELYARQDPVIERDGPLTVVYHGTMTYRYGIDVLLKAVAQARHQIDLRLILHGRGEFLAEIRRLIVDLGIEDIVTLSIDKLAAAELAVLIRRGDIGVVPNRNDVFTDGILPTKLMEYAALGVPAVVSRSSATQAYFDDSMVRYVTGGSDTEIADAIVELGNDVPARHEMALRAQAFTEAHPWSAEADRYVALVEAVAERRPRPAQPARRND
jgi:glycosyltransferase involved in cell wall biosynthesis